MPERYISCYLERNSIVKTQCAEGISDHHYAPDRHQPLSQQSAAVRDDCVPERAGRFLSDDESVDSQFNAKEFGRVISDFVWPLPERRRFIFVSRYYVAEPIDTIASDLSLSRSMVNKELAAIRKTLKEKLESEGYIL